MPNDITNDDAASAADGGDALKEPPAKKATAKKAATKKAAAKKAAAKKAATKKAPAKKAAAKSKKGATIVLADPDKMRPLIFKPAINREPSALKGVLRTMVGNVRDSIDTLHMRSTKKPVILRSHHDLQRSMLPYDEISFQHMLGAVGIRYPSVIEIVAPESLGSTTFLFDWIGRLADIGCYSSYCECEDKMMAPQRIKRLMDRDPDIALLKLHATQFTEARSLAQLDETIRKTVPDLRKRCDADPNTKGNPVFFFVDPWTALMSKSEARGNSTFGVDEKKKKEQPKETAEGSNFEHAKHAQAMARWLPSFLETHGCVLVMVKKQNDKVDMKKGPPIPSFLEPSPIKNDTTLGGRAFKRLAAYRISMLKLGDIRDKIDGKYVAYGHDVRMMAIKNSYGPRDRTCEFSVFFDLFDDRDGQMAPAMSYGERTAAWMASAKLLGTTVNSGLYTCDALGCVAVPGEVLAQALRDSREQTEFLGGTLGIEGYRKPRVEQPPPAHPDPEEQPPTLVPE